MTLKKLLLLTPLLFAPVLLTAQGKGIAPAELLKPLSTRGRPTTATTPASATAR